MQLVAGATGSLGGKIVQELLVRGHAVRALVRSAAAARPLERAGATVIIGDLTDPSTLPAACVNVDVVISTASATKRGDDTPENVDMRGTQHLIDAARDAGVRHFIYVSTLGASPRSPVPAFRAKAATEAHLRASGMEYTILQPNAFMDVWFPLLIEMPVSAGQPVTLVGDSRRRHSFVAERDVARFAVAAIQHPAARNATLVLGGPAALTFRDVVHAYVQALGHAIPIRSVAPGDPIPGLPEPVCGIAAALESYDSPVPMAQTARRFGVTLTSVRDFARESALGAAARRVPA